MQTSLPGVAGGAQREEDSMKRIGRFPNTRHLTVLTGVILAGNLGTAITVSAQEVQDLQTPKTPLVLKSQGSFTVGGEFIVATPPALAFGGHIAIHQMYVQYQEPVG